MLLRKLLRRWYFIVTEKWCIPRDVDRVERVCHFWTAVLSSSREIKQNVYLLFQQQIEELRIGGVVCVCKWPLILLLFIYVYKTIPNAVYRIVYFSAKVNIIILLYFDKVQQNIHVYLYFFHILLCVNASKNRLEFFFSVNQFKEILSVVFSHYLKFTKKKRRIFLHLSVLCKCYAVWQTKICNQTLCTIYGKRSTFCCWIIDARAIISVSFNLLHSNPPTRPPVDVRRRTREIIRNILAK